MDSLIGIGTDIVDIERVRRIANIQRFMEFYLTKTELMQAANVIDQAQFAATRFAAKEAVIKAFPERLKPHDFEIQQIGRKLAVRFLRPGAKGYVGLVSVAHERQFAMSYACVVQRL